MKHKFGLAIETSCDDTSVALLKDFEVIECVTKNCIGSLQNYGGVVPEIASRHHAKNILDILEHLQKKHIETFKSLDYIAFTKEPGLQISLHVGEVSARTLSTLYDVPIYEINHIHAHIYSCFINQAPYTKPFIALVASGKTTSLFLVKANFEIIEIASTLDDAIGEVFDKVGKALGMSYPGGPKIDKIFDIEKATIKFNFSQSKSIISYSGLKSQVLHYIKTNPDCDLVTLASSFQKTIVDNLMTKLKFHLSTNNVDAIAIGGGVASNSYLRSEVEKLNKKIFLSEQKYSCDNAAMIGYLCYIKKIKKN